MGLKKILLSIGILIILILNVSAALAVVVENNNGVTFDTPNADATDNGMKFRMKFDTEIVGVYAQGVANITIATLTDAGLNEIANATIISKTGNSVYLNFTSPVAVTGGTQYYILSKYCVGGAGQICDNYNVENNYPYVNPALNWTSAWYQSIGDRTNVVSIFTRIYTQNATIPENFSLTATNIEGTSLNNFSALINNTWHSTTTGLINTSILKGTGNIDIKIENATDSNGIYFNKTVTNIDTSGDYEMQDLYQADISFIATELFSGDNIGGVAVAGSSSGATLQILAKSYNVTWVNVSYYNMTSEFIFTPLQNDTKLFTNIYNTIIKIYGVNVTGGEVLYAHNGTITNNYYNYSATFGSSGNETNLNLLQGLNYSIYYYAENYTKYMPNNNKTINITSMTGTAKFNLYRDKSIFFYVKDILSDTLLDLINITISGNTSYNYSFNKTLYKFNLEPGNYSSLITKSGYTSTNPSFEIISGYLLNQTYYLSESATDYDFYVTNQYGQFLSAASVKIIRQSDLSVVASGTTDFSGGVSFSLQSSVPYYINVTHTGFQPFYETLNLVDTIYTITLTPSETEPVSYYTGILYNFTPSRTLLNNTFENLTFQFYTSGVWTITNCFLQVYDNTSSLIGQSSSSSCSSQLDYNLSTGNNQSFSVYGILTLNTTNNISYFKYYSVANYYEGDTSLAVALRNLKAFDKAGFNDFGRWIIIFMVLIGLTIGVRSGTANDLISYNTGIGLFFLIWSLTGFLSQAGWLTMSFIQIPFMAQWGTFILMTFILGVFIYGEIKGG